MRVSLLVGTTVYPLAGQAGVSERVHSSASDFSLEAQIEADSISRVRAGNAYDTDRGNLKHSISFSTTRKYSHADLSFLAALDYNRIMPRTGTLVFESINTIGEASVRHLLNALVYPPRCKVIGATLFLDYSVTGANIIFISDMPSPEPPGDIPATAILAEDGEPILGEDGGFILSEA